MLDAGAEVATAIRQTGNFQRVRTHIDDVSGSLFVNVCFPFVDSAVKQVHIPQEVVNKRRGGMIVDFLGRSDLLDLPIVHYHDPVGDFKRLFLIGDVKLLV